MKYGLMASSALLAEYLDATFPGLMAWLQTIEAQGHPRDARQAFVDGKSGESRALAHVMDRRAELAMRRRLILGRIDGFIRRHHVEGVGRALLLWLLLLRMLLLLLLLRAVALLLLLLLLSRLLLLRLLSRLLLLLRLVALVCFGRCDFGLFRRRHEHARAFQYVELGEDDLDEVVEVGTTIIFTIEFIVFRPEVRLQVRDSVSEDFGDDVSLMEFVFSSDAPRRGIDLDEVRVEL